jgi:phosphatidate cytidylyltransferase
MAFLNSLDKWLLLALFVLIWTNDTGAYCVGVLTAKRAEGNHKMFPRVSPKKSWEGLIGGIIFALAGSVLLAYFGWFDRLVAAESTTGRYIIALLFGALVCCFGTLGDLMESLLKRSIGVKDSGKFLPGHGGVLDRFDSVLLAAPVLTIFCWICYAFSSLG